MFEIGNYIIYGNTGVCRVIDISVPEHLRQTFGDRLYYTLSPVFGSETIYIPVDTSMFMRPVISRDEAEKLIEKIPSIGGARFEGKDRRETAENYRNFIDKHNCEDLVQLIKAVYSKNQNLRENGKKPGQTDTQFMKQAIGLLHGELAVALGIPIEDVPEYIRLKIEKAEATEAAEMAE